MVFLIDVLATSAQQIGICPIPIATHPLKGSDDI
jgi:hypothetical protein